MPVIDAAKLTGIAHRVFAAAGSSRGGGRHRRRATWSRPI